jgi:hypothetical protein
MAGKAHIYRLVSGIHFSSTPHSRRTFHRELDIDTEGKQGTYRRTEGLLLLCKLVLCRTLCAGRIFDKGRNFHSFRLPWRSHQGKMVLSRPDLHLLW